MSTSRTHVNQASNQRHPHTSRVTYVNKYQRYLMLGRNKVWSLLRHVIVESKVTSGHDTGVRKSNKCELMWHNKDHPSVPDATFIENGLIVYITFSSKDEVTRKLRARDLKGNVADLPFPLFVEFPQAVYGSPDGTRLAIIDWSGGKHHIIVYSKTSRGWSNRKITTTENIERVAMLPTGECVCYADVSADSGKVLMYNTEGELVWTKDLPHRASPRILFPVTLSTTPSGLIIVCDKNTHKVTVLDASGQQIHEFPAEFIKDPWATCVDSQGDVLVYDLANQTVSLYCIDGTFVKNILKHTAFLAGLNVFRDHYLLCNGGTEGLHLYEM